MELYSFWKNKRVFITGHTGFKGSWLSLWLKMLGAKVSGFSLMPESSPNHWDLLHMEMPSLLLDIRDISALRQAIEVAQPEVVFHLAAQSLVRRSYNDPLMTWNTNVMGTMNLLEICRDISGLKAIVIITSDKCYENREQSRGYREDDPLGGHDPYSASKAATEIVVSSYRRSFYSEHDSPLIASARAGNVIGGGDWSEDRLIPDLVRAKEKNKKLLIRYPDSTRPWQHVLDLLHGYLLLGQRLLQGSNEFAQAWNFGPEKSSNLTVSHLLEEFQEHWPDILWECVEKKHPHEAGFLYLDSAKAYDKLGWKSVMDFQQTIRMTADWYGMYLNDGSVISQQQLRQYTDQLVN